MNGMELFFLLYLSLDEFPINFVTGLSQRIAREHDHKTELDLANTYSELQKNKNKEK